MIVIAKITLVSRGHRIKPGERAEVDDAAGAALIARGQAVEAPPPPKPPVAVKPAKAGRKAEAKSGVETKSETDGGDDKPLPLG